VKKTEGSVFAVADAARLQRLSARLTAKLHEAPIRPIGGDEDEVSEEELNVGDGKPWFLIFGLMDCDEVHCGEDRGYAWNDVRRYEKPLSGRRWMDDVVDDVVAKYGQ